MSISSRNQSYRTGEHDGNSETETLLSSGQSIRRTPHGGQFTLHKDGHSYSYTYGPTGLAGLTHNYYALLCAVFASIGGLSFGYDQGVIANVLVMKDFLARWPITPLQEGAITAILELGALIGALLAGMFADRYSRRQAIFTACLVFCIGALFQCAAQTFTQLFIGRAVGGVGVGALSALSPLYMAEISPPEVRGSLMALEQFAIVLGVVVGFWLGFFTRNIPSSASWRIPLAAQLVPGVILLVGCAFLPASPRLLVLHGRYEEAKRSLAKLRLRTIEEAEEDPLIQLELLEMRVEATMIHRTLGTAENFHKSSSVVDELKTWKRLFGEKYRDRTMVGVLMMVFQQWVGINALLYYGPTLVRSIGFTGDTTVTLLVSGGIGIVQFIACLPAIVFIDKWGRKPLLRGGSAVMAFSHFAIAVLISLFSEDWASHSIAAWAAVGCIYLFTAAYGISLGPIGWVLPSEVFPSSMRSKGVALSTASNWINNFLVGLVTPVTIDYSPSGTFMMFAVAAFFAYLWSTYSVPETANVSLEEVDKMFRSSAGREESAFKKQIEENVGLRELVRRLGVEG
ncbi:general substrate transporter [Dendrothele bispora CBS 962.96]|uniref:General substrate transporter n=1 Tax=Dendrothele bispora (strain CBS 962.96) TaxID=1314807 RepID=A0A4V4HEE2_DENBC|nr:general substrate transporter [Dendrothele bispora CBS 962.96]